MATQKAGKALLALKRMALLSKGDSSSTTPTSPREGETSLLLHSHFKFHPWWVAVPQFSNLFTGFIPESPLSPEAMQALESLEHKMQGPPQFTQSLEDQTVAAGSTARLSCHLTGRRPHFLRPTIDNVQFSTFALLSMNSEKNWPILRKQRQICITAAEYFAVKSDFSSKFFDDT